MPTWGLFLDLQSTQLLDRCPKLNGIWALEVQVAAH